MLILIASMLTAAPADAGQRQLVVEAPPGSCVTEQALRDEVTVRLGRALPAEHGPFVISVSDGPPTTITLTAGSPPSVRTFTSVDCREALESTALAMAIAVDPAVLLGPPPPSAPVSQPSPAPRIEAVPVREPTPRVHVGGGLLGGLSSGTSVAVAPTFGLSVSLRRANLKLGLEGRLELAQLLTPAQLLSSVGALGSVIPGFQLRHLRVGLPLSVGALFLTSEQRTAALRVTQPLVLVGAEVAGRLAPLRWLSLEAFARVQFVATRISVLSGPDTVWVTWPVALTVGVSGSIGTGEDLSD